MKTLLTNARIIDGTSAQEVSGSVALEGQTISGVGQIEPSGFDQIFDTQGLVVAPGFIDTHSHSDLEVFRDNRLLPKICQGVTTELLGQDGISIAPLPEQFISPWRKNLAGLDGDMEEFDWTFRTTDNYLRLLEKNHSSTNLFYLAPHGNVRMEAMGLDGRLATADELKLMDQILERELSVGSYGLSTGLIYMPCAYSDTNELTSLCRVAARYDVPLVIHQRSEADTIIESMEEVISAGRDSGVKIHFSHFKLCGKNNAHLFDKVLALLDQAQAQGLTISFDQYPYVAGSTMLGVILPPWAHNGGTDQLLARLTNPADRAKMIRDIENGLPGWDNFVAFAGFDGIFITSVKNSQNASAIGHNLTELGKARGKDPLEATFDLLYEEDNAVGMVDYYGLEEHVKTFMSRPEQNVCTDGLMAGSPHPRVYGAFPRVLGKYVRQEKVMPLNEAVHKMTGRPASVFGLKDRGRIAPGYKADLVVFDPATIIDQGTFENPRQHPLGIKQVFVNGSLTVDNGQYLPGALYGQVLRRSAV
ncbi:MAG: D-aminoacylase [Deltaproteobacteria bacterium]|jgi:N-acyl-D-amino-acid deacylase|nr:D-aminoacylase [Deltaproteobacteria bacterium]